MGILKEKYEAFLRYDEKEKTMLFHDFSGGLLSGEHRLRKNTVSELLNMEPLGMRLVSMSGVREAVFPDGFAQGKISAHRYADGILLFRKGRTLYAERDGVFLLVGEENMLSHESGEIYDDGKSFFVSDGEDIYMISRELAVSKVEQKVPICFKNVSRSGAYFTETAPQNPFCRYIDVILSDESSNEQLFPAAWAVDPTYARAWHSDGREVYPGYIMLREDRLIFDGDDAAGCRLRLRLLDSDDADIYSFSKTAEYRELLGHPETCSRISFSDGKTMFLLSKGTELCCFLISDDGFSDCSENSFFRFDCKEAVTGVVAYDEGYLVFFENAIKKLTVDQTSQGVLFSLLPFQMDFGSDMRGSICSFDDKTVFASKKAGVFCIDRFGIAEKLICRKISANIENGEKGFFSHREEEYRDASAACAFGKYFLTVGEITYIWDYRAKLPSAAQSHADEAQMVWTMADYLKAERYLGAHSGKLYYTQRDTEALYYMGRGSGAVSFQLKTADLDFDSMKEKVLTEIVIRYRCNAEIMLSLYLDGVCDHSRYLLPISDGMRSFSIQTHAKRFRSISLALEGCGEVSLDALQFQYF